MSTRNSNNPWVSPTGFMNTGSFAAIGGEDPSPGAGARFPGLLGIINTLTDKDARQLSKTSIGTLRQGTYQLVKYKSTETAVARGSLLFWDTDALLGLGSFIVTTTTGLTTPWRAGVALAVETAAGSKFAWIQTGGLIAPLFGATPGAATGIEIVQATAADTPLMTALTVNTFLDATTRVMTNSTYMKSRIGISYGAAPTASVTNTVLAFPDAFFRNEG